MAVAIGPTTCPSFFNMLTLLFFSLETHSSGPNWQRGRVKLGHVVGPLGRCSPSALRFRGDMMFFFGFIAVWNGKLVNCFRMIHQLSMVARPSRLASRLPSRRDSDDCQYHGRFNGTCTFSLSSWRSRLPPKPIR